MRDLALPLVTSFGTFRVSPVMTTSRSLHTGFEPHELFVQPSSLVVVLECAVLRGMKYRYPAIISQRLVFCKPFLKKIAKNHRVPATAQPSRLLLCALGAMRCRCCVGGFSKLQKAYRFVYAQLLVCLGLLLCSLAHRGFLLCAFLFAACPLGVG